MKLSTKGRYAARAMLELAAAYGKGPIRLNKIAKKQEISVRYLERMMQSLVNAGLVCSMRGKNGGFVLSRAPDKICLSQIIIATEGPLSLVDCVDSPDVCNRNEICVTRDIWIKMKDIMEGALDSYSLEDMVRMRNKKLENKS